MEYKLLSAKKVKKYPLSRNLQRFHKSSSNQEKIYLVSFYFEGGQFNFKIDTQNRKEAIEKALKLFKKELINDIIIELKFIKKELKYKKK